MYPMLLHRLRGITILSLRGTKQSHFNLVKIGSRVTEWEFYLNFNEKERV